MGIYTDSVLEIGKQYTVQDVSHMKDYKYLIGQKVLLLDVIGSTASIRKMNKHYIPVRSLIEVTGYKAKAVQVKNADGFAVVMQNKLNIPIGTAYLNPTRITNTNFTVMHDGKEVTIPLDIVCSLVKDSKAEKKPKIAKAVKDKGIPEVVAEDLMEFIAPSENRKDIVELPASLIKLLPHVNIQDIRDSITVEPGVYSDMEGNIHETIAEMEKSNTRIKHKMVTTILVDIAAKFLHQEAEDIRNNN